MKCISKYFAASVLTIVLFANCKAQTKEVHKAQEDPWAKVGSILKNIVAPTFANRVYLITDFGAVGDGKTNCTEAFRKAITECNSKKGGGRVVVPAGKFLSGPIQLKSNVDLHIMKGATILFSTVPEDYLPLVYTRWEGVECMNYSSLIYAFEQENIAITGEGTLDGQATNDNWWPSKGKEEHGWKEGMPNQIKSREVLFDMGEKDVPVADRQFGTGHYLRPQFVQPYRCKNVLIEGVTIINSPMWIINPVLCTNVTIHKVTVKSDGPNNDGCDPESCKNVLIKECFFNTGDDCIAIKSGRNADGRKINVPCENVIIQKCTMANGYGGVVVGSEVSGGAKNIYAEDCKMDSPLLDRVLRIKTSSNCGGTIENVYVRNIKVGQVKEEVVTATMLDEDKGAFIPVIRNIEVKDIEVKDGGKIGVFLEAYEQSPIENVTLTNVVIHKTEQAYKFTNVKNIHFNNVTINGAKVVLSDADAQPTK